VMRDGRVAYDGPPLADHEVHHPDFGEAHSHHHTAHQHRSRHDHVPSVTASLTHGGASDDHGSHR